MLNLTFLVLASLLCFCSTSAIDTYFCTINADCPENSLCTGRFNSTITQCECRHGWLSLNDTEFCTYSQSSYNKVFAIDIGTFFLFPIGELIFTNGYVNLSTHSGRILLARICTSGAVLVLLYAIISCIIYVVSGIHKYEPPRSMFFREPAIEKPYANESSVDAKRRVANRTKYDEFMHYDIRFGKCIGMCNIIISFGWLSYNIYRYLTQQVLDNNSMPGYFNHNI
jgi:hypothetical protein